MKVTAFDYRLRDVYLYKSEIRTKVKKQDRILVTVTKPGYLPASKVIFHNRREVEIGPLWIDPRAVGVQPSVDRPQAVLLYAVAQHLGLLSLLRFKGETLPVLADRIYVYCNPSIVQHLKRTPLFKTDKNKGRGHEYEPGWKRLGSWRSKTPGPSLQAVVYKAPDTVASGNKHPSKGSYVVELDIDLHGGLKHIAKEVIKNALTGDTTDPIMAAQMCAYYWGLRLPFVVEANQ